MANRRVTHVLDIPPEPILMILLLLEATDWRSLSLCCAEWADYIELHRKPLQAAHADRLRQLERLGSGRLLPPLIEPPRRLTLLEATNSGNLAAMAHALELGDSLEERDIMGLAPIHITAMDGRVDAANLLLDWGCNVNMQTADGRTALYIASCEGHVVMVEHLLLRGANPIVRYAVPNPQQQVRPW